jgi:hypothetical protein
MSNENKGHSKQNDKTKIVLPKVDLKDLATLKDGKPWPKEKSR